MSFCCFPKIACFKTKSKIRSASLAQISETENIGKSFSLDRLKTLNHRSRNASLTENRSLPELNKSINLSRSSHKSTIAVRCAERFLVIQEKGSEKKSDLLSLDVSKISNISFSDQSCAGLANEIKFVKAKPLPENGKTSARNRRRNVLQFINMKKKETPPMFLKNPCFSSGNSSLQRSD
jgi:hypothetical protein